MQPRLMRVVAVALIGFALTVLENAKEQKQIAWPDFLFLQLLLRIVSLSKQRSPALLALVSLAPQVRVEMDTRVRFEPPLRQFVDQL